MHLFKGSYYLYLVRSGERSKRIDSRIGKSNLILQLVSLARAAVAEAYASLTAFCTQIAILLYVMKLLSERAFKFKLIRNQ